MSAASLVGTGIALGFVHILTGPDHLSALATLSANVDIKQAFSLGVRWGVGHSTGLVIVGAFFIAISEGDTVEVSSTASRIFESIVGVFMLLLGSYGLVRAFRKQQVGVTGTEQNLPLTRPLTNTGAAGIIPTLPTASEGASLSIADVGDIEALRTNPGQQKTISSDGPEAERNTKPSSTLSISPEEREEDNPTKNVCTQLTNHISTRAMAILVGIVHGIAGPGGVLGLIPAVQLRDWKLSSIYLGTFCLTSTLVMGCFAAMYGTLSSFLGKGSMGGFHVECFSACLSILVGILWLILVGLDKLDDIFP